jgi:hypothetical protein
MSKKFVIVVNGKARAGKDTVVELMASQFEIRGFKVETYSSIEPVHAACDKLGINTRAKSDADRDLLADMGMALEKHSGLRTRDCFFQIERFMAQTEGKPSAFFLHMREPELIEKVRQRVTHKPAFATRKLPVFKTVMVEGRGLNIVSNSSDANVGQTKADLVIHNGGSLVDLSLYVARNVADMLGEDR